MKMRKFSIIALVISGSMWSACSSGNLFMGGADVLVSLPPDEEFLDGEQIPLPENALTGSNGVFPIEGQEGSWLVHYFRQPILFSFVSSMGNSSSPILYRGRSGAEMTLADYVDIEQTTEGGHVLLVSDINTSKLISLDIENSFKIGAACIVQERNIPRNTNRVFILPDGNLLCQTLSGEYGLSYVEMNERNELQKQYKLFGEGPHARDYSFFISMDAIRPDKKAVVMCMRAFDKMNILDLEKGSHKTVVTSPEQKKTNDLSVWKSTDRTAPGFMYSYYYAVDCDENCIYAVYSPGNEVRVFDWGGFFMRRIKVKEQLQDIKVVKSDGNVCLIGLSQDEKLYRYCL